MIALHDELFLAEGGNRLVYRHPHDANLCVKVLRGPALPRDETPREVRETRRLHRSGCDFSHMARFHGWTQTNRGPGTIWDLALNYDGTLAGSFVDLYDTLRCPAEACHVELQRFESWCFEFGVLIRDLHPKNLVCKFDNLRSFRLVLIDGAGNNEFIPMSHWFSRMRQQKIARQWQRFRSKLDIMFSGGTVVSREIDPNDNWILRRAA